jgi:hypothetical protein
MLTSVVYPLRFDRPFRGPMQERHHECFAKRLRAFHLKTTALL